MTLEKLLIFGFALAVLLTVTTLGTAMWTERQASEGKLQTGLDDLGNM